MRSCMQAISIVIWARFSFSCTLIIEIETFFANYPHSNHFPLMKLFNLFNKKESNLALFSYFLEIVVLCIH